MNFELSPPRRTSKHDFRCDLAVIGHRPLPHGGGRSENTTEGGEELWQ